MKRILAGVTPLIAIAAATAMSGVNVIQEETPRPAPKRAAARLEAHRAIWDSTPSADHMTRQQIRRAAMSCCTAKNRGSYRSRAKNGWTWFCKKCGTPRRMTKGDAAKIEAESEATAP